MQRSLEHLPDFGRSGATRLIAVLMSAAASVFVGLFMLNPEFRPVDAPTALVAGALYLQPAALMVLPKRRVSLDLSAAVIALLLGIGPMFLPYGLAFPQLVVGYLSSALAGCLALLLRRYGWREGFLAVFAVILSIAALSAATIRTHSVCRWDSSHTYSCEQGAVSYVGAASAVAAMWAACGIVWFLARRQPTGPDPSVLR